MDANYNPQGWTIIKLYENEKAFYKIFATWRDDDRWRLSSGAKDLSLLSQEGDVLVWPQASGSTYYLPIEGENCCNSYQSGILENIKNHCDKECVAFDIIHLKDFTEWKGNLAD